MANSLCLSAPAKLNLFLHIIGRRSDGFHLLQTVFQFVDLCDTLKFEVRKGTTEITLSTEIPPIPPDQNLIVRAARLLQQHCSIKNGAHIQLDKRIPIGGGLGGGSSNAATTLLALNHLWDLHRSLEELAILGLTLGADVPVFIHGHAAWAEGIGEQLHPLLLPEPWYVIITPPCAVSTTKIYSDPELTRDTPPLKMGNFLKGMGKNDFEPLVRKRYPPVAAALDWLNQFTQARLTGSGSSVFGSFSSEAEAREIAHRVPSPLTGFVAKGLNCSPGGVSPSGKARGFDPRIPRFES